MGETESINSQIFVLEQLFDATMTSFCRLSKLVMRYMSMIRCRQLKILFPKQEILELCEVIYMNGYSLDESEVDEDTAAFSVIKFGDLFKMYTRISDKVVGLLLRAKKYRLVYFEPEMLFQGKLKSHIFLFDAS